jgi:hypothetical protein
MHPLTQRHRPSIRTYLDAIEAGDPGEPTTEWQRMAHNDGVERYREGAGHPEKLMVAAIYQAQGPWFLRGYRLAGEDPTGAGALKG